MLNEIIYISLPNNLTTQLDLNFPKMKKIKTHKANVTAWRIKVMNMAGLDYTITNNQIVYKGCLDGKTLVNFLVDKRIELGIDIY